MMLQASSNAELLTFFALVVTFAFTSVMFAVAAVIDTTTEKTSYVDGVAIIMLSAVVPLFTLTQINAPDPFPLIPLTAIASVIGVFVLCIFAALVAMGINRAIASHQEIIQKGQEVLGFPVRAIKNTRRDLSIIFGMGWDEYAERAEELKENDN